MVCAEPTVLQARLALRALFRDTDEALEPAGAEVAAASSFHKRLREEFDNALKASLDRRVAAMNQNVDTLMGSSGGTSAELSASNPSVNGGAPKGEPVTIEVQTDQTMELLYGEKNPHSRLADVFEKAVIQAHKASYKPHKQFRPKKPPAKPKNEGDMFADKFQEPGDNGANSFETYMETDTLKQSHSSLMQNLASRERQIISLKSQVEKTRKVREEEDEKTKVIDGVLQKLLANSQNSKEIREQRRSEMKKECEQTETKHEAAKVLSKRFQQIAQQQIAYYRQSETVGSGSELVRHHPAGEVFLAPKPSVIEDETGEDAWDVGTSFANPYNVDSWPFEPNVLARRCFNPPEDQHQLEPWTEETVEDVEEEERYSPFRDGAPSDDDDESFDDLNKSDEFGGPTATARSA